MPEADATLHVVREWIAKAENDLTNAEHTLQLGERCPTDTVCFHAQQCVEKYLKALLVARRMDFPKSHDLQTLIERLPKPDRPTLTIVEQRRLTALAVEPRYPGGDEPSLAEARQAAALARKARAEIRQRLPPAVLSEGDS